MAALKFRSYKIKPPSEAFKIRAPRPHRPLNQKQPEPWEVVPQGFVGSTPEWACYWALTKLGATFDYQAERLGGRDALGGAVIDFLVYQPTYVGIRIQGEYWHYGQGTQEQARDLVQRLQLEGQGIPIIDIDEDDIMRNPIYYVKEALRLISHSKGRRR